MLYYLLIPLAYLVGSLSAAIIVCRVMRLPDPRQGGSGNPGATNVLRLYGRKPGIIALAGDVGKGILPVVAARALGAPDMVIALTGLAAFVGHLYPLYFAFQGGKGVATLLGVLFGLHWLSGIAFMLTWTLVAGLFRYSSLAGMSAAVLSPVYAWFVFESPAYALILTIMAAVLLWRHRHNITRLRAGTESRLGKRA